MDRIINLNYDWLYFGDVGDISLNDLDSDRKGEKVDIPHTFGVVSVNYASEKTHCIRSLYKKKLFLPLSYSDCSLIITLEGVAHYSEVYVNGRLVGEHRCGYTAYSLDIAPFCVFGSDNEIAVFVDARESLNFPPFGGALDFLGFGGIYREVWLEVKEKVYIKYVHVDGSKCVGEAKMTITAGISCDKLCEYSIRLIERSSQYVVDTIMLVCKGDLDVCVDVKSVKLWSMSDPFLYELEVVVSSEGKSDSKRVCFGFRYCEFSEDGIYLNGEKLRLFGLNRRQSYPQIGYAAPEGLQKDDADKLYKLGCGIVRTCNYPNSRHFLDRCDELGMLVITEIPGWQYIGDEEWKTQAVENVKDLICEQYNHPSVVIWGVRINQSSDDRKLYTTTNRIAHELDKSRQTGGARSFVNSDLLEDVFLYNDYMYIDYSKGLNRAENIMSLKAPYAVAEHTGYMYPVKSFDSLPARLEQVKRHLGALNAFFADRRICAAIGGCFADYNSHKGFGAGDGICYHGVTDMFRQNKLAAYVYMSQSDREPVLELCDNREFGEYEGMSFEPLIILSNCEYIIVYNNGERIGKLFPCKKEYKYLPHPPFMVDSLAQSDLMRLYGLDHKETKTLIKYANKSITHSLGFFEKLQADFWLKRHIDIERNIDAVNDIITRAGKNDSFLFEGYIGEKCVISRRAEQTVEVSAVLDLPKSVQINQTYEVFQVVVKAVNQCGRVLTYINEVANISIEGDAVLVSDKTLPMCGGIASFYIKVYNEGTIDISVWGNRFSAINATVSVRHTKQNQ
ncbi:MAG: glycoside hydrolase family 2 TIM barrel-domain containing protein [Clostridia bacterium]|nr:glycoside hydrolase family 2 TIM barrel-domain containing protein [Clostridia bacterium]